MTRGMTSGSLCGLKPLLFGRKPSKFETAKSFQLVKNQKMEMKGPKTDLSHGSAGNFILMVELRKKIFSFRDIIDLPACNGSATINELVLVTMKDLHKLFPETIPRNHVLETKGASIDKVLVYFCEVLTSIGDSWMINQDWMDRSTNHMNGNSELNSEQLVELALRTLSCLIKIPKEKFDVIDEDDQSKGSPRTSVSGKFLTGSYSDLSITSCCDSPVTPTSVLPDFMESRHSGEFVRFSSSPLLRSLRDQAIGKLNPIDVKRFSFHMLPNAGFHNFSYSDQRNHVDDERLRDMVGKTTSLNQKRRLDDEVVIETEESTDSRANKPVTSEDVRHRHNGMHEIETTKTTLVTTEARAIVAPLSPSEPPVLSSTMEEVALQPRSPPTPPPTPSMSNIFVAPRIPSHSPLVPLQPSHKLQQNGAAAGLTSPPPMASESRAAPPTPPPPLPSSEKATAAVLPPPPPPPPGAARAVPPPPPTRMISSNGSMPLPPPPPTPVGKEAAPPPPPPGAARSLRPKKTQTKLKRSSQMGNLYRVLKGKVEGGNPNVKSSTGRKTAANNSSGGKQGMADALAEITKRSAYFQQIEEDVQKHGKSISELKTSINNFQTENMEELIKFHSQAESVLEQLTDETQVLARFDGFPQKKLEALRMATALYSKLNGMVTELHNWKIEPPLGQLLDKIERYFNKIKGEMDSLERTKDEEAKKFQSHSIHFDFDVLLRIKEAMVDVSSNCMELALKERREAKAMEISVPGTKTERKKACVKMLWRAFQLAFRVYSFAGGQDDRADKLTRELAHEIETDRQ